MEDFVKDFVWGKDGMFTTREKALIVRWLARLLAGVLLLFWGAFFLEHFWEWFVKPLPKTPPLKVFVGQFLHLALLLSYILAMRWDLGGACLIFCSAASFFTFIGIAMTTNTAIYIGLSILPGILLLAAWRLERSQHRPDQPG